MTSKDLKKEIDKASAVFYGSNTSGLEQGNNSRLSSNHARPVVAGGEIVEDATPDSHRNLID